LMPATSFVRNPLRWLELLHRHRGTVTYAPNFAYALVAKRLAQRDVQGFDLSCVRVAGCGAEPISAAKVRAFAECLAAAKLDPRAFVASYGMAEATLAASMVRPGAGLRTIRHGGEEIVSCGEALDGLAIVVVDPSGARVGEGEVGEILVSGDSIASYHRAPELDAETFAMQGGARWLKTGDLGFITAGELYICGRRKDLIIVAGRNYYPNDIEAVLGELEDVRAAVAFSVSFDGEEGVVICAEAPRAGADLEAKVKALVSVRLGLEVKKLELVPPHALPRTTSGKVRRHATRQMFLDSAWPKRGE
jgi:fatty-acyl-CoA synthase